MRMTSRRLLVALLAGVIVMATAQAALAALPRTQADSTWMVDSRVRALERAGGYIWIGGKFSYLQNQNGANQTAVTGLTALTDAGTPANVSPPTFTGDGLEVWDMYLAPDGVLYIAGKFGYTVGGSAYKNLVGIDPSTGAVVRTFKPPVVKSVYSDGTNVYAGANKLFAFVSATGAALPGFNTIDVLVDDSLRGHSTPELIRDIQPWGPWIVATGQFDYVNVNGQWDPQKVFFRFNPSTGAVDPAWAPANIAQQGGAWGHKVLIDGSVMYSAAGGSDYTAAYNLATVDSQGRAPLIWSEDTSGSSQSVSIWDANTLIVGGHFEWVEDADTEQCGSNGSPNTSCWKQPRLVALSRSDGKPIQSWTPNVCCAYNGVWITLVEGKRLHIGGEFATIGGIRHRFYGRMSEAL
jgi:hypothetical protein